ncbi:hypothetical protein [Mesorhizobium sp.]|nr:hypothetical protein [Mesorhizobium sp.]
MPEQAHHDVISVAEMVQNRFADARSLGINSNEIEEDTGVSGRA